MVAAGAAATAHARANRIPHPLHDPAVARRRCLLAVVVRVVVRVVVARDFRLHVVEHHAPHLGARGLEMGLGPLEHEAADLAGLVDEQHTVGLAGHDGGVGHRQHRRGVDQHDVVFRAHRAQELGHGAGGQELRRVGRDGPGLDDVQVVEAGGRHDVFHLEAAHQDVGHGADAVAPARIADQDVAQTGLALDAEEPVDARAAQVGADQQRLLAVLGHGEREVHDGGGLALLQRGAGDHQHLAAALQPRELDVRAQGAVGLGHRRLGIEVRDEQGVALQRIGIDLGQRRPSLDEPLHRLARIDVRHDAEHRDLEVGLDVLDGADRRIERLLHEGQHAAEHETEQRAHQHGVERLAADGRPRLGGRPHQGDFLDALRLLDQRLLVARLQEREEIVVDLGVPLQALQVQLDRRHLAVALHQIAHLPVEDLLAVAQERDLRVQLAAHLLAHLAQPIVDGLQPGVLVGHLQGQVVALENQLGLGGDQPLDGRILRVDVDALVDAEGIRLLQPALHLLELDALLPGLLDVAAHLGEQRQQHRGLGAGRDDPVGVAERPHLFLGLPDSSLDLLQLTLDELAGLDDAGVAVGLVVVAVGLGHRVGEVAGLRGVGRGGGDFEDAGPRDPVDLDLVRQALERGGVGARFAQRFAAAGLGQPAEPARHVLQDRVALDERGLGLDVVGAGVGQDLHQQAAQRGGLLELHRRGGLVDRHLLLGEPEAEQRDEDRGGHDDHPPAADDLPVVAEVRLELGHLATAFGHGSGHVQERRFRQVDHLGRRQAIAARVGHDLDPGPQRVVAVDRDRRGRSPRCSGARRCRAETPRSPRAAP